MFLTHFSIFLAFIDSLCAFEVHFKIFIGLGILLAK